MPLAAALEKARALGLDLVEVPGTRSPVVAKILDWNQFTAAERKVGNSRAGLPGSVARGALGAQGARRRRRCACNAPTRPIPSLRLDSVRLNATWQAEEEAVRKQRLREKLARPKEVQFTARIAGSGRGLGGGAFGGERMLSRHAH